MRELLATAVLLFGFSIIGIAQGSPQRPPPRPPVMPDFGPDMRRSKDISKRANEMHMMEKFPFKNDDERKIFFESIRPIYRESTAEEREALAPTEAVAATYTDFLKSKDTGLTRLAADIGCFMKDDVVSAKPECARYSMPGSGSSYSFRMVDYKIKRLADLNFREDRLEALGTLTHGILLYLGDTPIESVSLDSAGVEHLLALEPSEDFTAAGEFAGKLLKGFKNDNFIYASVMKAIPGKTYVLRSIAYDGEAKRVVKGIIFNELEFDERRDIVVAFSVAAMNPGEDVTIVWKELRNKKSPKLEAPK